MSYSFTIQPETFFAFDSEAEQIDKCKEWGLLSEKATKTKAFFYKGNGMNLACSIIGFVDRMTAVIEFENRQQHCIHPSYLKEMQASNYGHKASAGVEETADSEGIEPQATVTPDVPEMQATEAMQETQETQASQQEEALPVQNAEKERAEAKPKETVRKGKAQKLQLPDEKVKMIATVKEFTTVPNNFSDTDDEVIIYEAVSIAEPEIEVGNAWSSHSATLKKLELNIGDTIRFEGKIVTKKLTKHPVPYKINNPAKIQKEES